MCRNSVFGSFGRTVSRLCLPAFLFLCCWPSIVLAAKLTVEVSGLHNAQGKVAVAVFASAEGFPKDDSKAIRRVMLPIDGASHSAKTVLSDIAPGTYAIAAFHDDNNSGKLETNFFGVPKKGYGFSNNLKPKMRAANFDEARFTVPAEGASGRIQLQY